MSGGCTKILDDTFYDISLRMNDVLSSNLELNTSFEKTLADILAIHNEVPQNDVMFTRLESSLRSLHFILDKKIADTEDLSSYCLRKMKFNKPFETLNESDQDNNLSSVESDGSFIDCSDRLSPKCKPTNMKSRFCSSDNSNKIFAVNNKGSALDFDMLMVQDSDGNINLRKKVRNLCESTNNHQQRIYSTRGDYGGPILRKKIVDLSMKSAGKQQRARKIASGSIKSSKLYKTKESSSRSSKKACSNQQIHSYGSNKSQTKYATANRGGRKLLPFPSSGSLFYPKHSRSKTNSWNSEDNKVYCICKRPSFGDMIACDNDSCKIEWFHYKCVDITTSPKGEWFCPYCKE